MRTSPAKLMIIVWGICILLWIILPFRLSEKSFSSFGIFGFLLFFLFFLLGCWSTSIKLSKKKVSKRIISSLKYTNAYFLIKLFSIIASVFLFFSFDDRNVLNLNESYQFRSDQADALLNGMESSSSIFFQIAFLLYPAGFIYLVLHLVYEKFINFFSIFLFGFLPIILATLVMGGRFPILYAFAIAFYAWRIRKRSSVEFGHELAVSKVIPTKKNSFAIYIFASIVLLVALYYFSLVFFVRAETLGGSGIMFAFAEEVWGIKFDGLLSGLLFSVLGGDATFLLFTFAWYAIQGFVMTNFIFTSYDGPLQFGSYGIDIFSAIFRRIGGDFVTNNFSTLQNMGTYGFLPSSFGSLFVDFGFLGIIICFLWGRWSTLVYKKTKVGDVRSLILLPFMLAGILFSLINTPFGFTNGFITYLWLFLVYFMIKPQAYIIYKR